MATAGEGFVAGILATFATLVVVEKLKESRAPKGLPGPKYFAAGYSERIDRTKKRRVKMVWGPFKSQAAAKAKADAEGDVWYTAVRRAERAEDVE